jgi:hypothetical protein
MSDEEITIEDLKKAKKLDELKRMYEKLRQKYEQEKKPDMLKKAYKIYEKRKFELKLEQYRKLKEELSQHKKKIKKDKIDVNIKVIKKFYNSRLATSEHYICLIQQNKEGINLMFMKKVRLEERDGYLLLVDRKSKKSWVIEAEPFLLERPRFPFGKKLVALHFTLPDYPYTLNVNTDLKNLKISNINVPSILHSLVKTKFFEALTTVGGNFELTPLIIGTILGISLGVAIGFGVANANLTHILVHHVVTNSTTITKS